MRIKNVNPKGWYDIPGYDGIYQINYWADIRKKLGNGKYKHLKPYVKKNNQGKRLIKLKRKEVVVMSLMRITFIGDLPKGYVTYHKNGIKTDDILGNIGVIAKKELSRKNKRCQKSAGFAGSIFRNHGLPSQPARIPVHTAGRRNPAAA